MGPTIPVTVMGHHTSIFKSISRINTAPIPIFCIDTPTQMEPSFNGEKRNFWAKNTVINCPQIIIRVCSFLVITFFNYLNLPIAFLLYERPS
jgi:hypothetical protein